jgi:hypothetical protein
LRGTSAAKLVGDGNTPLHPPSIENVSMSKTLQSVTG